MDNSGKGADGPRRLPPASGTSSSRPPPPQNVVAPTASVQFSGAKRRKTLPNIALANPFRRGVENSVGTSSSQPPDERVVSQTASSQACGAKRRKILPQIAPVNPFREVIENSVAPKSSHPPAESVVSPSESQATHSHASGIKRRKIISETSHLENEAEQNSGKPGGNKALRSQHTVESSGASSSQPLSKREEAKARCSDSFGGELSQPIKPVERVEWERESNLDEHEQLDNDRNKTVKFLDTKTISNYYWASGNNGGPVSSTVIAASDQTVASTKQDEQETCLAKASGEYMEPIRKWWQKARELREIKEEREREEALVLEALNALSISPLLPTSVEKINPHYAKCGERPYPDYHGSYNEPDDIASSEITEKSLVITKALEELVELSRRQQEMLQVILKQKLSFGPKLYTTEQCISKLNTLRNLSSQEFLAACEAFRDEHARGVFMSLHGGSLTAWIKKAASMQAQPMQQNVHGDHHMGNAAGQPHRPRELKFP